MAGTNNMISDLLLGFGVPTAQQAGTATGVARSGTGLNFAALLGMLTGTAPNTMNPKGAQFSLGGQRSTGTGGPVEDCNSTVQLQALLGFGMNIVPATQNNATNLASSPAKTMSATMTPIGTAQSINVQLIAANGTGLSMPVRDIPEGNYRVKDASVSGGNLNLTLVHKDDSTIELKVTLPTSQMPNEAISNGVPIVLSSGHSGSSPILNGLISDKHSPQIENLLTQLKGSEVSINQPHTLIAETPDQVTSIQITTEQKISTPLVAEQVTSTRPNDILKPFAKMLGDSQTENVPVEKESADSVLSRLVSGATSKNSVQLPTAVRSVASQNNAAATQAEPFFRAAAVKINNRVMNRDFPSIAALMEDKGEGQATSRVVEMNELSNPNWNASRQGVGGDPRADLTAVKVTVPRDLSELLSGSHKSVSLKIDPQYLGPARLSLVMRGEVLTAKITVETQQAKAALDLSMSQLNDQLAHAGVKVDLIDVNVRGGGADSQTFHRPQEWFTQSRSHSISRENELAAEIPNVQMAGGISELPSYVNGRGVNLYA